MGNEKIKPCPFCGGTAEFIDEADDWYSKYSVDDEWVSLPIMVRCVKCGATIQAGDNDAKEDVINQWNTREILDIASDANDDQIYTSQERADLLFELIDKYNKYED